MSEALTAIGVLITMIALGVLIDTESRTVITGRQLKEGTRYPWWAGLAWNNYDSFDTIVMIIPLNYRAA